ncbi:hypothetical Protein YC6258_04592 [Gynuella sunshinyii YC6258]|uniref:Uncharacterized protein n=1 Tax=Gynuella sunshinyii YC6258 TaxID=1445510 RepID=A0A0C5W1R5_9GAMM|nr:hypothetical Protein YC6258_04592 [Gynuella sunshinyii YC6258]
MSVAIVISERTGIESFVSTINNASLMKKVTGSSDLTHLILSAERACYKDVMLRGAVFPPNPQ